MTADIQTYCAICRCYGCDAPNSGGSLFTYRAHSIESCPDDAEVDGFSPLDMKKPPT